MTDKRILIEQRDQAKLLLSNDLFADALTAIRTDALLALAEISPTDPDAIRKQQAIVFVTGEIKARIEAHITAAGDMDGGYTLNSDEE